MEQQRKHEEVKPLTLPSPTTAPLPADHESLRSPPSQFLRQRRCAILCGCCGATTVILGLIVLILAFTVFKVKDPVLTMNAIYVDGLTTDVGSLEHPLSVNATLTADISIKNPNVASFAFGNSTTEFYYEGQTVGVAYAPDGRVKARRTVRMNVTVDVLADRVGQTNATGSVVTSGVLDVTTFTDISGRVDVMGIYKRDVEMLLNCTVTLNVTVSSQEVAAKVCVANVR